MRNTSNRAKMRVKYEIAFQLSKIMLTIHSIGNIQKHGHLSSHNVFVNLQKNSKNNFELRVRISDFECFDFMDYSNKFYNYRIVNVWSPPECLENIKIIKDQTQKMDTYSFGMILWELMHQSLPFDHDVSQAQQYVFKEESRPKIIQSPNDFE